MVPIRVTLAACLVSLAAPKLAFVQAKPLKELADQIGLQYRAIAVADTASLAPMLADDLVWIIGPSGASVTKTQFLAAVSCPSSTTCLAVGTAGTVVASTDGGATWSLRSSGG